MLEITIDVNKCKKDGLCASVCPKGIFVQREKLTIPEVMDEESFAQTKEQSATKRLRNNFLIPNLYFASAWAFPGGGFEGSIMAGFLAALQMNRDKIWSECDADKYVDKRKVKLVGRKEIDESAIELSFEKPEGFQHQKGQYAILNLIEPKVTELDLPYRWLPIASSPEEQILRFHIESNNSSFNKSCQQLNAGDKALVFGPVG